MRPRSWSTNPQGQEPLSLAEAVLPGRPLYLYSRRRDVDWFNMTAEGVIGLLQRAISSTVNANLDIITWSAFAFW